MKNIHVTEDLIKKLFEESLQLALKNKVTPASISLASLNTSQTLGADEKAVVKILPEAGKKLLSLVKIADKEVAWHGTVERSEVNPKEFLITDILVFPQKVTGATVDTDDEEYSLNWLYNANGEGITDEQFEKLRYHGHSHVNMGVFPSATDTTYQKHLLENTEDFYIFSIHNKSGAVWCNIYDVVNNCLYENTDVVWEGLEDPSDQWARDQIKKWVKEKTYTYSGNNYAGNNYYSNYKKPASTGTQSGSGKPAAAAPAGKTGGYPSHISTYGQRYDDDYDEEFDWEAYYTTRFKQTAYV